MNPNSTHQLWSRWTVDVQVPFHPTHLHPLFFAEMKRATASYFRKLFGSASEMRLLIKPDLKVFRLRVEVRTEGPPANESDYRKIAMNDIGNFFGKNLRKYGRVNVHVDIVIEAGDPGNGNPPSQLIIAPPISIH